MIEGAEDVGFHGCYFLLNGKYGLSADRGCTLLAHCGFENNHRLAGGFENGDAGIRLMVRGTLIGCTAYSIHNQTRSEEHTSELQSLMRSSYAVFCMKKK